MYYDICQEPNFTQERITRTQFRTIPLLPNINLIKSNTINIKIIFKKSKIKTKMNLEKKAEEEEMEDDEGAGL